MTARAVAGIVGLIVAVIAVCGGLVTAIFGGVVSAGCTAPLATGAPTVATPENLTPPVGRFTPIGQWNSEQVNNAAVIITTGMRMHVSARGWVIAVATAMQESSLVNLWGGDRDSVGLFQQRPSQGWGSPQQLHTPMYAATKFYTRLLTISGWQTMPLTAAAQKVQRSAYPDAYAKWEADAEQIVTTLTGTTEAPTACTATVSDRGWTQPVKGTIGSGFRTPDRSDHDGVDLIVRKATPVHAAATGTVTTVRCDAIDVRTGAGWGCDRDGDPNLTQGCGWYVDITHPGGVVTRYCHLLTHPFVAQGQHVNVGDVIGVSGSSGHSSGPHLHFEVHLGDHTAATAVDPVPFMASVGAPLGPALIAPIPYPPNPSAGAARYGGARQRS